MEKRKIDSYEAAVAYILDIPRLTSKNTIQDTKDFLQKLGNPDRELKIIHVAGTNGKGSVCAYLASLLKAKGLKTCRFTSPHLVDIRERFLMGEDMVTKEAFLNAFLTVYDNLPWKELKNGTGYHPTFFEYLFFMAMLLFKAADADYCILETGLGGRLDATNAVLTKELAVITRIGIDHTEYLGDTMEKIAAEKAGIMHESAPAIYWETNETVAEVFAKRASTLEIQAHSLSKNHYRNLTFHNKSIDFSYQSLYYDSVRLSINTFAAYQAENATLALCAAEVLFPDKSFTPDLMQAGLMNAFWAGRMEEVGPDIYVDGAHNEDGLRAFLETVSHDGCSRERHLIFGVVADKAYEAMIHRITESGLFSHVYVAQLKSTRAVEVGKLTALFTSCTEQKVSCFSTVKDAFVAAEAAREEGERIYIAGSLYLVGEIKEFL